MPWIIFTLLTAFVALGVRKMMREQESAAPAFTHEKENSKTQKKPLTAQDTVMCTVCKTYVVKGRVHCGVAGCPHPSSINQEKEADAA